MRQKGFYANCFGKGYFAKDCRKPLVCDVNGCGRKHSKFLPFPDERAMKVPEAQVYLSKPKHLEVKQQHHKKPAARRQVILQIVMVAKLLCQLYLKQ